MKMETLFEKEVIQHLNLPSIPKKEWDGKSSFSKGVALLSLRGEREAYAVASFDADVDKKPNIVKVFGIEPFVGIKKVFVVPTYMTTEDEIKDMDLDEQSKKKVEQVLNEAKDIENDGTEEENPMENLPEWSESPEQRLCRSDAARIFGNSSRCICGNCRDGYSV